MKNKNENENWDNLIDSNNNFSFNFSEIVKYKDLIYLLVKRDFVTYYKQTILGPLWYVIQPLFMTIVFTFIFGKVAKISTDGIPPFLFYLAGNVLWSYYSTALTQTSSIFVTNAGIFGKVYFPRIVAPISSAISCLFQFIIQFFIFIIFIIYFYINGTTIVINYTALLVPLVILYIMILSISVGMTLSALTSKYRDLTFALTFFIQLWMFVSPVIYPLSSIPQKYHFYIFLNPMTFPLEYFRLSFLGNGFVSINLIFINILITFIFFIIGLYLFRKVEKNFMDTV